MALLQADGTEANTTGPWWAKTVWMLGPLTIMCMGLVYWLAMDVSNEARAAATTAAAIQRDLSSHQHHTEMLHKNIEDYMRVQNLLTRQLCANAAKSSDERNKCFVP